MIPGTTYYIRAYATNAGGTGYGNQLTFITGAALPTVSTIAASNITFNSAIVGGNVSNDGGALVTSKGVCWSTSQNPTLANSNLIIGSGLGSFNDTITGLSGNTTYYVRAFATNSSGTAYGNQVSFTTFPAPSGLNCAGGTFFGTVSSPQFIPQGYIQAYVGQQISITHTSTGNFFCNCSYFNNPVNATVINSGCSQSAMPININEIIVFNQPGVFNMSSQVSECITPHSCTYSIQVLAGPPIISTSPLISITYNSAIIGGNVTNDGGSLVTSRGICWSTTQNPTIANSSLIIGSGLGSYNDTITGLSANTTYYVRAFATNSNGTAYGQSITIITIITMAGPQVLSCNYCGAAGGQDLSSPLMVNGVIYANTNQQISMTSYKCGTTEYLDCASSGFSNPNQANVLSYNCTQGTGNNINQIISFSIPGVYSVTGFAGSSSQQKVCTVSIVVN